jgi:hypothetical protein
MVYGMADLQAGGHLTPTSYSSNYRLKTPYRYIASAQKAPLQTLNSIIACFTSVT